MAPFITQLSTSHSFTQLSFLYLPIHHPAVYLSRHHPAVMVISLHSSSNCLPLGSSPSCHVHISPFILQLSTSCFILQLVYLRLPTYSSCPTYLHLHPPAVYLSFHHPAVIFISPHSFSSCLPFAPSPSCHFYISPFITQLSYLHLPIHHPAVIFTSPHSSPSCHIYISPFITQLSYLYLPIHHPAVYFSFHHQLFTFRFSWFIFVSLHTPVVLPTSTFILRLFQVTSHFILQRRCAPDWISHESHRTGGYFYFCRRHHPGSVGDLQHLGGGGGGSDPHAAEPHQRIAV